MDEKQQSWKEIREELGEVGLKGITESQKGTLTKAQGGLISGFADDIYLVLQELEKLEEEIVSQGVASPDLALGDRFKQIFSRFQSIATGSPPLREGIANKFLNEAWECGIRGLANFLERRARAIGIEGWSLGATVGFPSGVSGTIILNFKAKEKG